MPHAELVQPEDSILSHCKTQLTNDRAFSGQKGSRYNAITHAHAQFAGAIIRLGRCVDEVLRKLEEEGLDENTIIVSISDSGPHEEDGANPAFFGRDGKLRGLKRQYYGGGIRVPSIIRQPDQVTAGTVNNHQCAFYDIMSTLYDLTGARNFPKRYVNKKKESNYSDGISFTRIPLGKKNQKRRNPLYWELNETGQVGVRMGDWKMVVKKDVPSFYNLTTDIYRDHNVAAEGLDIMKGMIGIIHWQHMESPNSKVTLPVAI